MLDTYADYAQAARTLVEGRATTPAAQLRASSPERELKATAAMGWAWQPPKGPYGKGYLSRTQVVRYSPAVSDPSAALPSSNLNLADDTLQLAGNVNDEDDPSTASLDMTTNAQLIHLTHHVVYSPTYRVPQLLLTAHHSSSGAALSLLDLLSSALLRLPQEISAASDAIDVPLPAAEDGGAIFPLLNFAEHPVTGEAVWSLHPCHLAEAVEEVLAHESSQDAPPSCKRWLETWLMIVGTVVDLRYHSLSTFAVSSSAHPILDAVLAGSLIVHTHIGFDACIVDYLHTRKFPVVGAIANWGLRAATLAALWGAYEFNTNDVGMVEVIRKVWTA